MRIEVFWQPACPNCPAAKELGKKLEEKGIKVEYFNTKEPSGLAKAVMHNIMATPSIAVMDASGKTLSVFRSKVPKIDEILVLKK